MNEIEKQEYLDYLASRKSSHKTNWYLASLEQLKSISGRPKLLLHACCGPCAGWPLEFLQQYFTLTVMFNNSNIYPQSEHDLRNQQLKDLLSKHPGFEDIDYVELPYDAEYTKKYLSARASDPEGWKRCFTCYEVRMRQGFEYAKAHGFPYYSTVMTISRQKDSQILNQLGLSLQKEYPGVTYFVSDFKKKGGQVRRDQIVEEYQMYHQDYCGCVYSYQQRNKKQDN